MAERHGEAEGDEVLEGLSRGQGAFARQGELPLHIVAGVRRGGDEADTALVVPDVMAVVVAAAAVFIVKVSTGILRPERSLNWTMTVTIQAADGFERLSR